MANKRYLAISILIVIFSIASPTLASTTFSYSVDFDLHNMAGFDDNTISSEDIVAFIQEKYPDSPMLSETDIGSCFISAGQTNNVNPAFLVATACLESGFGTLGWAASHSECHNAFGYDIPSGSTQPGDLNCMDSWCSMIERVASVIAHGTNYYAQGLNTVGQVRGKYAASPNADSIASLMNELYAFSINRKSTSLIPGEIHSTVSDIEQGSTLPPQIDGSQKATKPESGSDSSAAIEQPPNMHLPSGAPLGQIATAPLPDGRPHSFAADKDGKLWTCWKKSTEPESGWTDWKEWPNGLPSGVFVSQVEVVTLSDGRLQVWIKNVNGKLYMCQKSTTDSNAQWTHWVEIVIPRQFIAS